MTTLESIPSIRPARAFEDESLFDVQLLVARRADALARGQRTTGQAGDRRMWLKAEREVLRVTKPDVGGRDGEIGAR